MSEYFIILPYTYNNARCVYSKEYNLNAYDENIIHQNEMDVLNI